jgi:hypothetical protein
MRSWKGEMSKAITAFVWDLLVILANAVAAMLGSITVSNFRSTCRLQVIPVMMGEW